MVTRNDIGPFMRDYAEEHDIMTTPRRMLVGSYRGDKILLSTPLLQWYLMHGLIVDHVYQITGRKIHAGTRHFAVLPLSLAVKPLKCAEGARHDLLPCPDCQHISKWGESACQTDNKPQYLFSLLHA